MAESSIRKLGQANWSWTSQNHLDEEWTDSADRGAKKVVVPSGIYVKYLPPYSPKIQPAERLWSVADEPLVNKSFD